MLIFGLRSTSDDWPSDLSNESQLKREKRPHKSSKNEMLISGLRSTSDDQPSDLSDGSRQKCSFSLGLLLFQSWSSVVQSGSSVVIIIIVLVTLILSGSAVAMFHQV